MQGVPEVSSINERFAPPASAGDASRSGVDDIGHADRSLGPEFFEAAYAASRDPWNFETSEYEREKYATTLAAIDGRTYARAFEIGCSIGVLTQLLASRVGTLLAVDCNERALSVARERCASIDTVRFERAAVPQWFPDERFDLVIVSEVGYYWSRTDLNRARDQIARAARAGTVELVHFLPKVPEYPSSGDDVHQAFLDDRRFVRRTAVRAQRYRIDVFDVV